MQLHISNCPLEVTAADLAEWLGHYGTVTDARVIRDPDSGRSRRYGFAAMPNESEARAAIAALDRCECDGRILAVTEAGRHQEQRHRDDRQARTVFAGGLPYSCTQSEILTFFSAFGTVERVFVPIRNGQSRGIAFITFATIGDASSAIAQANGAELGGRCIGVAFAQLPPRPRSRAA